MRKNSRRVMRPLCILLVCALALAGCAPSGVREDIVRDSLPNIDPAAGVEQTFDVTLYFRLIGEPVLVPMQHSISVRASEYTEHALVSKLLDGPSALSQDLESALPPGVRLVEAYRDGSIMYVTFNRALIDPNAFSGSREEQELSRRLAVYAVVNSLCTLTGRAFRSVQIRIDLSGTGEGVSVAPSMLGFGTQFAGSQWMEPLAFSDEVVATPERVMTLLMDHLSADELAGAWPLFAESEVGGMQKPDYAAMETEFKTLGRIESYVLRAVQPTDDGRQANATLDIVWTPRDGETQTILGAKVVMPREGELYKVGYRSFLTALQG